MQNRDGGMPTFCRGWGTLPFDRSTPEITAHALRGVERVASALRCRRLQATLRAPRIEPVGYPRGVAAADGTWIPLWFGNEHAPDEDNPVYGTARVLPGLDSSLARHDERARHGSSLAPCSGCSPPRTTTAAGVATAASLSSLEETAVVVSPSHVALVRSRRETDPRRSRRHAVDDRGHP